MKKGLSGLLVFLLAISCRAELRLPALFSDGMVLQREQEIPVWGWADSGATVRVAFAGQKRSVRADGDGRFSIQLEEMRGSSKGRILKVSSGGESVQVENVLVGEVWLCSGQSNMKFTMHRAANFNREKAAANHPLIRYFNVRSNIAMVPQDECAGSWEICSPDTVGDFSAVAYFFGREIQQELNIPVGLVCSGWGGTKIEAWSPMGSLEKFPTVMENRQRQDAASRTFDPSTEEVRYAKVLEQWNQAVVKSKAEGEEPPRRPKKKIDPHESPNYPANLYNAMIHPLVPYGTRGAIWYQGESNASSVDQAIQYRNLLKNMVAQWRSLWGSEFPFYAVQLPGFRPPRNLPSQDTPWVFIREVFLQFSQEVPNTGIAVAIDVGEADDIHPKNKQPVGFRLARQALVKTYGKAGVADGPVYTSMKKNGNTIVIRFDSVGSGLMMQGDGPLKTFSIAGADKHFVAAQAEIEGNTVRVGSTEVADPVAVRYAWANNPEGCNLFNKEGFPASPFRTDDWPPANE